MTLHLALPRDIQATLVEALLKGGADEIGGIMMAEHVGPAHFRVVEITVQLQGGSFARFVRAVLNFMDPLKAFFKKTFFNYRKFNYIGEWHSHPSFALEPSGTDCETMQSLVEDSTVGANFAILLLVRLGPANELEAVATVFVPHSVCFPASVILENDAPRKADRTQLP